MSIQEKAASLFGGAEKLAGVIAEQLSNAIGFAVTAKQVRSLSRQGVLDRFSSANLVIDQVMPIDLKSSLRQEFLEELALKNSGGMGANGMQAPTDLLIETHIRWEALNHICVPVESEATGNAKMQSIRSKYQEEAPC